MNGTSSHHHSSHHHHSSSSSRHDSSKDRSEHRSSSSGRPSASSSSAAAKAPEMYKNPAAAASSNQGASSTQKSSYSYSHQYKHSKYEEALYPKLRKYENLPLAKKGGSFLMFHGLTNVKTNFTSALPYPPLDSKLLLLPDSMSVYYHAKYKYGALERSRKRGLLAEANMGIDLGLIDPRQYTHGKISPDDIRFKLSFGSGDRTATSGDRASLHETDRALLRDEREEAEEKEREGRKRSLNREATWLMKREYMARGETTLYGGYVKKPGATAESQLLVDSDDEAEYEEIQTTLMDTDSTYDHIRKQFEKARELDAREFVHPDPKKRHLKPVSVLPIFPDYKLWCNRYTYVTFDANPIAHSMYPDHPVSGKPYNRCTHHEYAEIREHMYANYLVNTALLGESHTYSYIQQSEYERAQGKSIHVVDYMLPKSKYVANDTDSAGAAATHFGGDGVTPIEYQHVREYLMKVVSREFDDSYVMELDEYNGVVTYNRIRNRISVSKRKEHSDDASNSRYRRLEYQKQDYQLYVTRSNVVDAVYYQNIDLQMRDLEPIETILEEEADAADDAAQPPQAKRARLE